MSYFSQKPNEHGNVFFYILLAIALFAALTYAVSNDRDNSRNIYTDEQAKLAAKEIIEYGNTVANAVNKLRLRGCSDTEISFENTIIIGYSNTNSPTDKSCDVFNENGGKIEYQAAPNIAIATTLPIDQNWHIAGDTEIEGVGNTLGTSEGSELLFLLDDMKEAVCVEINKILDITDPSDPIPQDSDITASTPFTGSFTYSGQVADEVLGTPLVGKTSGCFYETDASPEYFFYQVLIAR